ncbi:hypothetical protein HNO92_003902 [Chromobacterium alkanivorans]|jgi:hypothetical protein|uniref:hypothetical protein n=1 Tax=Chromobacterium TaxID=535 RepID=UPI000B1D4000|nr:MULTISPECIES: hypothetical protein [Chromobacterium]MBN3002879.1 hypothetical protein [Chromobacterium alkanivorans]MCS3803962.1 hypothetical protein [Chromobacterium alkanivorans]MCS3817933.1 hypothetical protein [Chromobacterium alkanivorans]MCS3875553.1 hypothetical protein [Chromobacterium alkanivorans]
MQQYQVLSGMSQESLDNTQALLTLCEHCASDVGILAIHGETDQPCELCGEVD